MEWNLRGNVILGYPRRNRYFNNQRHRLSIYNAWGDEIPAGAQFRGYIQDFGAGPVAVDHEWWTANGGGFGDVGTQFIEDGSWVKLREISLTYDFDKSLIERLGLSNLSLSVSGRNFVYVD